MTHEKRLVMIHIQNLLMQARALAEKEELIVAEDIADAIRYLDDDLRTVRPAMVYRGEAA